VNNLRGEEPLLGVHPVPWPDPASARRWYDDDALGAAVAAWRRGGQESSSGHQDEP